MTPHSPAPHPHPTRHTQQAAAGCSRLQQAYHQSCHNTPSPPRGMRRVSRVCPPHMARGTWHVAHSRHVACGTSACGRIGSTSRHHNTSHSASQYCTTVPCGGTTVPHGGRHSHVWASTDAECVLPLMPRVHAVGLQDTDAMCACSRDSRHRCHMCMP